MFHDMFHDMFDMLLSRLQNFRHFAKDKQFHVGFESLGQNGKRVCFTICLFINGP
jgi:hypothetical protein